MNDRLFRIYVVKIRPELHAYGINLTELIIREIVSNLSAPVIIAGEPHVFDNNDQEIIIEHAIAEFGVKEPDHVYVRGGGFYQDDEEVMLNKADWYYYQKHRDFISDYIYQERRRIVESIDFETDQIIKKIPNPMIHENAKYLCKGLVIGYVQSGKTANFTHLISKAASIGYRFIIVLGGLTNTLRNQTQFRLDRELTGDNHYGKDVPFVRWAPHERKYFPLTGSPDLPSNFDGDFHIPVRNFSDHFAQSNDVTIAIIKKLARRNSDGTFGSVIGRLIRWIENRNDFEATMPPLLVIDDEADLAGIDANTPGDEDLQPTVINHGIRYLISLFNQVSYVGYTATPFANVFIDSQGDYGGLPDLYPESFIYCLPEPESYFGTKQFFGTKRIHAEREELVYIEEVQEDERLEINEPQGELTDMLVQAFWDFIYSVIVRRYRENADYCGFMIHTDHRTDYQNIVYGKVIRYFATASDLLEDGNDNLITFIIENWSRFVDKSREIAAIRGITATFPIYNGQELIESVWSVLGDLRIKLINYYNDLLDYNAEDLEVLICIGGNMMSRGVTIEGLTISYYLRNVANLDTLLQMGRWFGYRSGYEDLLRIYTTNSLKRNFEFVMGVEDDLRSEVNRYQEERLTPLDFAPRVRAHITMMPSGKMGSASRTRSYSRQNVQTIYLNRDMAILTNNHRVVCDLLEEVYNGVQRIDGRYLINQISSELLVRFLNDFITVDYEIAGFDKDDILRYLQLRINSREIPFFDLCLSGRQSTLANALIDELPHEIEIYPVKRSARKATGWNLVNRNIVNIGVISDSNDIPGPGEPQITVPKLIIYSIDRINSDAFKSIKLEAGGFSVINQPIEGLNFNPKGFALIFPRSNQTEGEYDYYQQIFNN